jgi:hypothetical protein
MSTIKFSDITKAVEQILSDNLKGYDVNRNVSFDYATMSSAIEKGWIGIYRGKLDYIPISIPRWQAEWEIIIEVLTGSYRNEGDAEAAGEDAVKDVIETLMNNLKLNGQADMSLQYSVIYDIGNVPGAQIESWISKAEITLKGETKT